jgi:transposase
MFSNPLQTIQGRTPQLDEALSNKLAILISIPGIAKTTAFSMLIEMPELGTLEGKQAAVSPASHRCRGSRANGKARNASKVCEHFYGGPSTCQLWSERDAIPGLKAKYDQLIRAGKSGKVAVTAIMRKLIVMANALLRDGRKWSELRP